MKNRGTDETYLRERLRKFAWTGGFSTQITTRILRLVEVLKKIPGARKIADQLERCAPSIGHNYAEALTGVSQTQMTIAASSLAHFISIIEICEREARETQFALGVVIDSQFVKPSRLYDLDQESGEIVAIMQKATHDFVLAPTIGKRAKERRNRQIAPNKNR